MRKIKDRKPRKIGGRNYAFVTQGYPSTINRQAKNLRANGYRYRIFIYGRQLLLYVGPKRRSKGAKKTKRIKKAKKPK